MTQLVGVDWGTSSLRCALIDGASGQVRDERHRPQGIQQVPPGQFAPVLIAALADWDCLGGTFCLISGMAGSRGAWREAPYCPCPAGAAELVGALCHLPAHPGLPPAAIVPGVSSRSGPAPEVMRGEETQVLGALDLLGRAEGLFILPGTHSKWVHAAAGRIEHFCTWMTGEVYGLLRHQSILARLLPREEPAFDEAAFRQGLDHAAQAPSLLRAAFSTRTLALFDRLAPEAAPSYLSGLVIGDELRHLPAGAQPVLVGDARLTARWRLALAALHGIEAPCVGAEATWRGLWRLSWRLPSGA